MIKEFFLKIWHTLFDYIPTPEEQAVASEETKPYNPEDVKNLADPNNPGSVMNETQRFL